MLNEAAESSSDSAEKPPLTFHRERDQLYRRSVLDLLYTFGRPAITSHIICDIDMSAVEGARRQLQASGAKITITAYLLKAIALAQINCPESRTQALPWGRQVTFNDITAGFTVERLMPTGPTVFFGEIAAPHTKTVADLSTELKKFASAEIAAVPALKMQKLYSELPGFLRALTLALGLWFPAFRLRVMPATFGFSSLGALGIDVVFGPSVCTSVFGVGQVSERAVVQDAQVVVRPMLTLMLSFDERAMDVGVAARFLGEVKLLLEQPPVELC